MPYLDVPGYEGKPVTRVTEPLSSEYSGWLDQHHPKKWERKKRIDYSAIRGTLVHNAIENWICKKYHIPRRDRKPMKKEELRIIREDLEKPFSERKIYPEVKRCFVNFLKYWDWAKKTYDIQPLYVEQKVYSFKALKRVLGLKYYAPYAGTMDLLPSIKIKGKRYLATLDWKSSKMYDNENFPLQTSAYREATLEMIKVGKIRLPDLPFWKKNICVILGGTNAMEYQSDHNFKGWAEKWKNHKNPKKQCDKKSCYFCGDIIRCDLISSIKKAKILSRPGYLPKNHLKIFMKDVKVRTR